MGYCILADSEYHIINDFSSIILSINKKKIAICYIKSQNAIILIKIIAKIFFYFFGDMYFCTELNKQ